MPGIQYPKPPHVGWHQITPHLPRTWRAVGRPHPIPGGALFITTVSYAGHLFHQILRFNTRLNTVEPLKMEGQRPLFPSNTAARKAIGPLAERITSEFWHDPERDEVDEGEPDPKEYTDYIQDEDVANDGA